MVHIVKELDMNKSNKKNYRIKVKDFNGNLTYLVRKEGKVSYYSKSEVPLALSNLASDNAAELRFKLEDAYDGSRAVVAVRAILGRNEEAILL